MEALEQLRRELADQRRLLAEVHEENRRLLLDQLAVARAKSEEKELGAKTHPQPSHPHPPSQLEPLIPTTRTTSVIRPSGEKASAAFAANGLRSNTLPTSPAPAVSLDTLLRSVEEERRRQAAIEAARRAVGAASFHIDGSEAESSDLAQLPAGASSSASSRSSPTYAAERPDVPEPFRGFVPKKKSDGAFFASSLPATAATSATVARLDEQVWFERQRAEAALARERDAAAAAAEWRERALQQQQLSMHQARARDVVKPWLEVHVRNLESSDGSASVATAETHQRDPTPFGAAVAKDSNRAEAISPPGRTGPRGGRAGSAAPQSVAPLASSSAQAWGSLSASRLPPMDRFEWHASFQTKLPPDFNNVIKGNDAAFYQSLAEQRRHRDELLAKDLKDFVEGKPPAKRHLLMP